MAVVEFKKIQITTTKDQAKKLINYLHIGGFFEPISLKKQEEKVTVGEQDFQYEIAQTKFVVDFLINYEVKEKVPLIEKIKGNKIKISNKKLQDLLKNYDYQKIVKKCEQIENNENQSKQKLNQLNDELNLLKPWRKLPYKLNEIKDTKTTSTLIAHIQNQYFDNFLHKIQSKIKLVSVKKINSDEKFDYLIINFDKNKEKQCKKIFNEFEVEEIKLPDIDITTSERVNEIKEEIKDINRDLEKDEKIKEKLAKKHIKNFKVLYDYFNWQEQKRLIKEQGQETKQTFSIIGWIQERIFKPLDKSLAKMLDNNYLIEELEIKKSDKKPVSLSNNRIFEPFESVTGIYGMPKIDEPDPTPFLAPFFFVFFGLCLTDAGYGLFMMALFIAAIKIFKIPKENSKLFRVLIFGGISTFIFGALFGGWLGIDITTLPPAISNFLLKIRIINPMTEPLKILMITFILGIIQVITGISIDAYWKIKTKRIKEAIFDSFTWIYLLASICFWILSKVAFTNISQIATYIVYSAVLFIILTQGRTAKNIFVKLIKGIMSLYGIVGYISDVLSYSRILALGLATGIIAMVINMVAMLFKDMIPYAGWVIAILVLIGGHLFNIAINVLGSFIHSGRLQFVEFFPKFMEGGGKNFKPIKRISKYIRLGM